MDFSIGNFVTLRSGNVLRYAFQNFFIGETIRYDSNDHVFLPFGFSGVTINRTGDNTDATLVLPNNQLSRNWSVEALRDKWLAQVDVVIVNPANRSDFAKLHSYVGLLATGTWDETSLKLTLNTVLDAVGADVPKRRLTQSLIGAIPVTNVLQLQ
jgi:hypothetical protein